MVYLFKQRQNIRNKLNVGEIFFLLGTLFLPSAFPIGALFLLISLVISFLSRNLNFLDDLWNYPFFICLGIILISSINASFINIPEQLLDYDKTLIWINLFNWIPILFGFWGFQNYLEYSYQKIRFSKFLLIGSIPVLISCILQSIFSVYGPFKALNGLIIWFQYPPPYIGAAVTGLFSNANYTACFLSVLLPFALLILKISRTNYSKIFLIFITFLIIYFTWQTHSRNGFLSLFFVLLTYFGIKRAFTLFSTASIIIIFTNFLGIANENLKTFFGWIIGNNLSEKIFNVYIQSEPRIAIWTSSINFISKKPFLGWGASTFSHLFNYHNESVRPPLQFFNSQHTHNLFLELAHNFGLPLAFIILFTTLFLFLKVIKKLKTLDNAFDYMTLNAWLTSTFIILLFQTTDITYYDGKISLIIIILLAGLKTSLYLPINQRFK